MICCICLNEEENGVRRLLMMSVGSDGKLGLPCMITELVRSKVVCDSGKVTIRVSL